MAGYEPRHSIKKEIEKYQLINFILKTLILTFIVLIGFSAYKIIDWYMVHDKNNKIMEDLAEAVTTEPGNSILEEEYRINFELLKAKNSDTVAWLKVPSTQIEYAVVQGEDNDYYLTHNFYNVQSASGWVFADYTCKFDGTDRNIPIYGHNMKDNSMFASLKEVIKPEWYDNEANYDITLITENEIATYRVFSVYQVLSEDYFLTTNFKSDSEFSKFVNTIKSRSKKDFGVEVSKEDQILTLSTCATNDRYRVVLHAKKI